MGIYMGIVDHTSNLCETVLQDDALSGCSHFPLLLLRRLHSPVRCFPCPGSWLGPWSSYPDLRWEADDAAILLMSGLEYLAVADLLQEALEWMLPPPPPPPPGTCDASGASISSSLSNSSVGNSPSLSGTVVLDLVVLEGSGALLLLASRSLSRPVARLPTRCAFLSLKCLSSSTSFPFACCFAGTCEFADTSASAIVFCCRRR